MNKRMLPANSEKGNKDNVALIIGFVLIVLVIIITLFRGNLFSIFNDNDSLDNNEDSSLQVFSSLTYTAISANDLNKKILTTKNKAELTLLDIRPFESYITEHIVDSINISLDEFPVSSKIDAHSQIIIIAENSDDKDIDTAVDKLKEEKIENIKVLAGGMEIWKQLIGNTVTYGNPNSFVDQSKVSYIDPEMLNDAITQNVPVYIVDVRTPDEFTKGHIAGAINIPFDDLEKKRSDISERRVVVVGINELQEFQASVQLYDMLLVSPFVMRGAMPAWESKGFPLVTN